jgi:hypothetical protein
MVDPSGLCGWTDPWDCVVPDDMSGVGNVVRAVINTVSGVNGAAVIYAYATGGNCYQRGGRTECDDVKFLPSQAMTMGDVVLHDGDNPMSEGLFKHESNHSNQWAMFGGWGFVPAYIGDWILHWGNVDCMWLEGAAGLEGTSYHCGSESAIGDC